MNNLFILQYMSFEQSYSFILSVVASLFILSILFLSSSFPSIGAWWNFKTPTLDDIEYSYKVASMSNLEVGVLSIKLCPIHAFITLFQDQASFLLQWNFY